MALQVRPAPARPKRVTIKGLGVTSTSQGLPGFSVYAPRGVSTPGPVGGVPEPGDEASAGAFAGEFAIPERDVRTLPVRRESQFGMDWSQRGKPRMVQLKELSKPEPQGLRPAQEDSDLDAEVFGGALAEDVNTEKQRMTAEAFELAASTPGATFESIQADMLQYPEYKYEQDLTPVQEKALNSLEEEINLGPFDQEAYIPGGWDKKSLDLGAGPLQGAGTYYSGDGEYY